MDFRPTDEQELLRRTRPRVRRSRDPAPRHGVGRGAALSRSSCCPKLAALGLMGIQFPERYGGAGDVGGRLLHLHRGARARLIPAWRCRSPRTTGCARRTSRCSAPRRRSSSTCRALVKGEKLGAWGLTEAGAGSDAAAMRTTAVRDGDGWVIERLEEVHHARQHRRRDGGDGGHRSRRKGTAASPPSSSSAARRA